MPTGYTAKIAEGISFREYALACARAFSVCIEMRDDSADAPIPDEFKPSDYHEKQLAVMTKKLDQLKKMRIKDCEKRARGEYESEVKYRRQAIEKDVALKVKCEEMLAKVNAYVPPSKDHNNFKEFMASQIKDSIKFDCSSNYHHDALKNLRLMSDKEWQQLQIDECLENIAYHSEKQQEENEKAASRTKWIRQLKESLDNSNL